MTRSNAFIATALLLFFASQSFAGIILDFRDPTPTDQDFGTAGETLETGSSFTIDGLTVSAVPFGDSLSGNGLLANSDSFGVDSVTTETFTDVADDIQFDGSEQLAILFDETIEILAIDLQGLVGDEVGRVTAGSFTIDLFTGVDGFNGNMDLFIPATPIVVARNVPVVFEGIASGAAFGLQGLTVNVLPRESASVVPEPGSVAIWSLLGFCMVGCSRRRRDC